jgi:hypothetical protein
MATPRVIGLARILAGLSFTSFAPGRSGSVINGRAAFGLSGSTPRIRPHSMTATMFLLLLRAGADPVIGSQRTV